MNYKILKHHVDNCYALKNVSELKWSTAWSYVDTNKVEYRDSIGRLIRNGSRWFRIRCNCTHCPAEIILSENYLLGFLPSGGYESQHKQRTKNRKGKAK